MDIARSIKILFLALGIGFIAKTPVDRVTTPSDVLEVKVNQGSTKMQEIANYGMPDTLDLLRKKYMDTTPARIVLEKRQVYGDSMLEKKFYPEDILAILINASENPQDTIYSNRYTTNIDTMISAFERTGVLPENIYVLDAKSGREGSKPATIQNLYDTLEEIRDRSTEDNLLLRYITNHGFTEDGQLLFSFEGELLNSKIFEYAFTNIEAGGYLSILAPCQSYAATNHMSSAEVMHTFSGPGKNAIGYGSKSLAEVITDISTNKGFQKADLNRDGEVDYSEISIETAKRNEYTDRKQLANSEKPKREVHRLVYRELHPKNIIFHKKPQH